jgi:hypothetical protein
MTVSHEDLQRSLGRVEGNQDGFRERMDRFERMLDEGFEKVGKALDKIDHRLTKIEDKEQERKGAWRVIVAVAGAVSGLVAAVIASAVKYFAN